jgi:hypothetical protein
MQPFSNSGTLTYVDTGRISLQKTRHSKMILSLIKTPRAVQRFIISNFLCIDVDVDVVLPVGFCGDVRGVTTSRRPVLSLPRL